MVCQITTPLWINQQQTGLLSAVENVADGYVSLTFGQAQAVSPGTSVYYLVYYSTNLTTVYDVPKLITQDSTISLPSSVVGLSHYIGVRIAQLGIADIIDSGGLIEVVEGVFLYPPLTELTEPLAITDGYVIVDSTVGYPEEDGYLFVGNEVILYSHIVDGYTGGFDAFAISNRDPFGCNDVVSHADGYEVALFKGFEELNAIRFKASGSCAMLRPTWTDSNWAGIRQVADSGIGTAVTVSWREAYPPPGFSRIYFNLYQGSSLLDLSTSKPIGFSTAQTAIVPELLPGQGLYFAVKATYQLTNLSLGGFEAISSNFYAYPEAVLVDEIDGYYNTTDNSTIVVSATDGFPTAGYLRIASEILRYDSKTSTSFHVVQRDVFQMDLAENYPNGTDVEFFKGIEDGNLGYYRTTPSWDAAVDVPWMPLPADDDRVPADGYNGASYGQDTDGYRATIFDIVNEDHSEFEEENSEFNKYTNQGCFGYRQPANWARLYSRDLCGTYSGGSPDGFGGGINVWEASTQRAELLLIMTGSPFILLRRKWVGKRCPALSMRSEHPQARCSSCYGTSFLGGFDRFISDREIRSGVANPNGFVPFRITPYSNDLELTEGMGLAQTEKLEVWTLPIPIIKDRDVLIRYTYDKINNTYTEEFRYEVLQVQRNKLLFDQDGIQKMTINRLDPTREIYKYDVDIE